jgi:hypothetical protein
MGLKRKRLKVQTYFWPNNLARKEKCDFSFLETKTMKHRSVFPAFSLEKGEIAFCLFRKFVRRKAGLYFSALQA